MRKTNTHYMVVICIYKHFFLFHMAHFLYQRMNGELRNTPQGCLRCHLAHMQNFNRCKYNTRGIYMFFFSFYFNVMRALCLLPFHGP